MAMKIATIKNQKQFENAYRDGDKTQGLAFYSVWTHNHTTDKFKRQLLFLNHDVSLNKTIILNWIVSDSCVLAWTDQKGQADK